MQSGSEGRRARRRGRPRRRAAARVAVSGDVVRRSAARRRRRARVERCVRPPQPAGLGDPSRLRHRPPADGRGVRRGRRGRGRGETRRGGGARRDFGGSRRERDPRGQGRALRDGGRPRAQVENGVAPRAPVQLRLGRRGSRATPEGLFRRRPRQTRRRNGLLQGGLDGTPDRRRLRPLRLARRDHRRARAQPRRPPRPLRRSLPVRGARARRRGQTTAIRLNADFQSVSYATTRDSQQRVHLEDLCCGFVDSRKTAPFSRREIPSAVTHQRTTCAWEESWSAHVGLLGTCRYPEGARDSQTTSSDGDLPSWQPPIEVSTHSTTSSECPVCRDIVGVFCDLTTNT
mmetsp:Transcript_23102/g.91634  ORF Transcript_23102/g.91634 Transcript_23102/m.91634 type:complete len:345 (-) Transcript_23102:27-1061(-)